MANQKTAQEPDARAGESVEDRLDEGTVGQASADAAGDPAGELAGLAAENAELRERILRLAAEMENLRKRTEREVRDASQYAIAGFARDMLSIGDNMRRALEAVADETRQTAEPAMKSLLDGIEMTERELLNGLERHGIRKISPQGDRFDPNFHQAMFEVPDESVPSGTVVQVIQAGFTIGERVLRPAMVGVSRGGRRPGSTDEGGGDDVPSVDRTA